MIITIDGINAPHYQSLLKDTYALRARVFRDRLGWDVKVRGGLEYDEFDALNPTTLVSVDDAGHVVGCIRILQTTGPNMLADVFASILQGEPAPRSPLIWEATRFCVDTNRLTGSARSRNSISYVTSEIMVAACEYAMEAGVTDAIAVIDPIMNRVMKRSANAPYDYLGKPTAMGKVTAMAALLDCSMERRNRLRDFANITGDVFLPEDQAIARFSDAARPSAPAVAPCAARVADNTLTLRTYCAEQLRDASGPNEIRAALRLITEIEQSSGAPLSAAAITHASS